MLSMLRGVVLEGTGTEAAIPGYTVAGKTGTAAKIDAERPLLALPVCRLVRRPRAGDEAAARDHGHGRRAAAASFYGGDVAAPAFREIARFNLQHLEVPPDAPRTPRAASRAERTPVVSVPRWSSRR